jgi:hypothetical protein
MLSLARSLIFQGVNDLAGKLWSAFPISPERKKTSNISMREHKVATTAIGE